MEVTERKKKKRKLKRAEFVIRCNLDSNEAGKDDNNRASQGEATAPVDEYRNIEAASRLYG